MRRPIFSGARTADGTPHALCRASADRGGLRGVDAGATARYVDQVWYGALVAALAYAFFMTTGIVYFLAAALLFGNVANDIRRRAQARRHHHRAPAPSGA